MPVHKKLMQARLELAKRDLKKTGENKFAGYKYFELGDFLPTAQAIFADLGLCGVVSFTADTATLTITDTEDNTSLAITSPMGSAALKGCHEVQNIGAVETYQRRYLWVSAFEIVEHDALDATTGKAAPDIKAANEPAATDASKSAEEFRKQRCARYLEKFAESVHAIKAGLDNGDFFTAAEAWYELPEDAKRALWVAPTKGGPFSTRQRELMRCDDFTKHRPQAEEAA